MCWVEKEEERLDVIVCVLWVAGFGALLSCVRSYEGGADMMYAKRRQRNDLCSREYTIVLQGVQLWLCII